MKKIIMYTKNDCPNCNRAKFMLGVAPVEVKLEIRNIDEDENARVDLVDVKGIKTLPTLVFTDGDVERVYAGWEENIGKIQSELGL